MGTGLYRKPLFRTAGDRGLLMELGNAIDPDINNRVRAVAEKLSAETPSGVVEVIPTYCSIILQYDPAVTSPDSLMACLTAMEKTIVVDELPPRETVELPVCYDTSLGPDLEHVAEVNALSVDEVIQLHTAPLYPVYMIGFAPGFPYLGGLSEKLHTSRLASPRSRVPAGSVGIANNQTGIYPIDSPGGWQLIGRCPERLFDPERKNPILLQAGSLLRFTPISLEEFYRLKGGQP
ncbi:MAG: 5-oxoprolinase subunit PxpB [Desulfobacteraceae bacterium]